MTEIIIKYLENQATDPEKKQLLDWLNESEANQKEFNDFAEIWFLSDGNNGSSIITKALDKLREEVDRTTEIKPIRSSIRMWQRIAAGIAVILICSLLGYMAGNYNSRTESSFIVNQYISGEESKSRITLPDGTSVWLNANSKIKYPEVFSEKERVVELEGEAYFDVTKDESYPFKVITNNFKITVLGTSFDVRSRPFDELSQAVLLTGKIKVEDSRGQEYILNPNQKITYDKLSKGYKISEVIAENYILWKESQLEFQNEKLSVILDKLGCWYGIEINYPADIAKDTRLSLLVRKESKEEIFRLLDLIAPIRSTIDSYTGNVNIKKK